MRGIHPVNTTRQKRKSSLLPAFCVLLHLPGSSDLCVWLETAYSKEQMLSLCVMQQNFTLKSSRHCVSASPAGRISSVFQKKKKKWLLSACYSGWIEGAWEETWEFWSENAACVVSCRVPCKTAFMHVKVCAVLLRCLHLMESELEAAGRVFKHWNKKIRHLRWAAVWKEHNPKCFQLVQCKRKGV